MRTTAQVDFELALKAARALRKDVEDEAVAVQHAPLDELLEVALLAGREGVVDENDLRRLCVRDVPQLLGLAAAQEVARIGPLTPPGDGGNRQRAGGNGQLLEFLQVLRVHRGAQPQAHEYGALTSPWAFEH
jgi:hypothetical protein